MASAAVIERNRKLAEKQRIDLSGQVFGKWTVLSYAGHRQGKSRWVCRCTCGKEQEVHSYDLRHKKTHGCLQCKDQSNVGRPKGSKNSYAVVRSPITIETRQRMQDAHVRRVSEPGYKPPMPRKPNKGKFHPARPEKYVGNTSNIIYRSGLEFKVMRWLDRTPAVISWSSEEVVIPYVSPIDNAVHRYFPDFLIKVNSTTGPKTFLVEVKPEAQCKEPVKKKRNTKAFLTEVMTYGVNQAKWKSAREWCKQHNIEFLILTEKEIEARFR